VFPSHSRSVTITTRHVFKAMAGHDSTYLSLGECLVRDKSTHSTAKMKCQILLSSKCEQEMDTDTLAALLLSRKVWVDRASPLRLKLNITVDEKPLSSLLKDEITSMICHSSVSIDEYQDCH
jgi:hypothetical protein